MTFYSSVLHTHTSENKFSPPPQCSDLWSDDQLRDDGSMLGTTVITTPVTFLATHTRTFNIFPPPPQCSDLWWDDQLRDDGSMLGATVIITLFTFLATHTHAFYGCLSISAPVLRPMAR